MTALETLTESDPKLPHLPIEEKPKKPESFLVRPEDISDAADSTDLLDTLMAENMNRIEEANDLRMREDWASKERDKIRDAYYQKALAAYMKMWDTCMKSKLKHNWQSLDVRGYTVHVCQTCSYGYVDTTHSGNNPHQANTGHHAEWNRKRDSINRQNEITNEMNLTMVNAMKTRMIELDEEAGILEWPTADDYDPGEAAIPPLVEEGSEKVKKWFARG